MCVSPANLEVTPFRVAAAPQTSSLHAGIDTSASRKDTSSNTSAKDLHDLGLDCMSIRQINKRKSVLLPFRKGLPQHIGDLFFNKYPISKLETGGEKLLFRPYWGINVNDHSIDHHVCIKILYHMVLPRDIVFALQISSSKMMKYFSVVLL